MTNCANDLAAAHRLAGQLFGRIMSGWADIYNFRQLGQLGLPHAAQKVAWQNERGMEEIANSEDYADMFLVERAKLKEQGFFEKAAADATSRAVATFENTLDAASLIFAHSLLDDIALDWIRVCALAAPNAFIQFVGQKKFTLEDARSRHFQEMLNEAIGKFVVELSRDSLMKKMDMLFAMCHPPSPFNPLEDYSYDRIRLTELDQLRHEYVHNTGPTRRLPRGDSDLLFLQKTAVFMLSLVNFRFGIKIDIDGFFGATTKL